MGNELVRPPEKVDLLVVVFGRVAPAMTMGKKLQAYGAATNRDLQFRVIDYTSQIPDGLFRNGPDKNMCPSGVVVLPLMKQEMGTVGLTIDLREPANRPLLQYIIDECDSHGISCQINFPLQ